MLPLGVCMPSHCLRQRAQERRGQGPDFAIARAPPSTASRKVPQPAKAPTHKDQTKSDEGKAEEKHCEMRERGGSRKDGGQAWVAWTRAAYAREEARLEAERHCKERLLLWNSVAVLQS